MKVILHLPHRPMIVVQLVQECALLLVVQDVQINVRINAQDVQVLAQGLVKEDVPVAVLADVLVLVKETATDIVPVVVETMDVALTANQLDAKEMAASKIAFMIVLLVVGLDIN